MRTQKSIRKKSIRKKSIRKKSIRKKSIRKKKDKKLKKESHIAKNETTNSTITPHMNKSIKVKNTPVPNTKNKSTKNESVNKSINESINESKNESINKSKNETINESINETINESINESINETTKNESTKNESVKNEDLSLNGRRKASYNKNSGNYLCEPTNFELILPPTHKPSPSVIGKKNMTYYKIQIPPDTEAGSKIKFKQPTRPIKNIYHNDGKTRPNCPRKQKLRSVNHIPTISEIQANISKKMKLYKKFDPTFQEPPKFKGKNYNKKSLTSKAFERANRVAFASDQILGTNLYQYTPGAMWFSAAKSLTGT